MAPYSPTRRKPRPPLDQTMLDHMALHYVGRFATSRAKLIDFLKRKLRERGWAGEQAADLDSIAEKMTRLGYVDDQAFAAMKGRALVGRGFGERRVSTVLRAAGIGEEDGAEAISHAEAEAVNAALHFAQRRRIGPYAKESADGPARNKAIAAMLRAGHRFALARSIVDLAPGTIIDDEWRKEIG